MTDSDLRTRVAAANRAIDGAGLVTLAFGNVSGVDRAAGVLLIKPSGVPCADITPADLVAVRLDDGGVIDGDRRPSTDTPTHRRLYLEFPDIGGVVHTHSTYAVAWAARGQEIPCVITAMADEFGGPIPVGPFAIIGDDSIGRGIVETLTGHRSRAVLMQNHGPFTIGATAKDAVKAAVMLEDVARTVHIAAQGGPLIPIPQEAIDRLYTRYQSVYGQATDERR